jgi:hypothetical protein
MEECTLHLNKAHCEKECTSAERFDLAVFSKDTVASCTSQSLIFGASSISVDFLASLGIICVLLDLKAVCPSEVAKLHVESASLTDELMP